MQAWHIYMLCEELMIIKWDQISTIEQEILTLSLNTEKDKK